MNISFLSYFKFSKIQSDSFGGIHFGAKEVMPYTKSDAKYATKMWIFKCMKINKVLKYFILRNKVLKYMYFVL